MTIRHLIQSKRTPFSATTTAETHNRDTERKECQALSWKCASIDPDYMETNLKTIKAMGMRFKTFYHRQIPYFWV